MCEDGVCYGNCGSCKSKPAGNEGEVRAELAEKKLKDLQKQLAEATLRATTLERKLMELQAK